jgi:hypothetical protein
MQELIEADILVMARGFFSYYAALISDGIKIFQPVAGSLSRKKFFPLWHGCIFRRQTTGSPAARTAPSTTQLSSAGCLS